jgi:outer membrane protein assembly factor BamD
MNRLSIRLLPMTSGAREIHRSFLHCLIALLPFLLAGCFFGGGKRAEVVTPAGEAEPDKILYEKGLKDVEKGRYEVARLTLQTLLNTYPDSDYKEKAKLAIADSFFKQGGTSGLIQAEAEYKDFRTFFPTSEDADDAQMRIAQTHYNQMEKPDRDATQAKAAERELKAFLEEFPDSPLRDEASQKLREVQEVLAEGNLRVASHYMIMKHYDASINRTTLAIRDYPDFSRQDEALWVLGQALERKKQIPAAGYYYGKIVSEHPLSPLVENARKKLEDLNLPIPEVNPEALARAQADQENMAKASFMGRVMNLFSKKPNVSSARRSARPPVELGPERINLEAAKAATSSSEAAPATNGGADSGTGTGLGVEIINRNRTSNGSSSTSKEKNSGTDKKN